MAALSSSGQQRLRSCKAHWKLKPRTGFLIGTARFLPPRLPAGCTELYTEDLTHGRSVEGVKIVNPFREAVYKCVSLPALPSTAGAAGAGTTITRDFRCPSQTANPPISMPKNMAMKYHQKQRRLPSSVPLTAGGIGSRLTVTKDRLASASSDANSAARANKDLAADVSLAIPL